MIAVPHVLTSSCITLTNLTHRKEPLKTPSPSTCPLKDGMGLIRGSLQIPVTHPQLSTGMKNKCLTNLTSVFRRLSFSTFHLISSQSGQSVTDDSLLTFSWRHVEVELNLAFKPFRISLCSASASVPSFLAHSRNLQSRIASHTDDMKRRIASSRSQANNHGAIGGTEPSAAVVWWLALAGFFAAGWEPAAAFSSLDRGVRVLRMPLRYPLQSRHSNLGRAPFLSNNSPLFVSTTTPLEEEILGDADADKYSNTGEPPQIPYNDPKLLQQDGVAQLLAKFSPLAGESSINVQISSDAAEGLVLDENSSPLRSAWANVQEKIGTVDDDRLLFPELDSGEVPRLFSTLNYQLDQDRRVTGVTHAAGSVLGAAALVAGTTVGAGVLALPTATAAAGFGPSSLALIVAWVYMTFSGLLIAELTLNNIGTTGRPGLGLLELYQRSLGQPWTQLGGAAYFFLHYAMMVAYLAQGGVNVDAALSSLGLANVVEAFPGVGQVVFGTVCGLALLVGSNAVVETVNNWLVLGVAATFLSIVAIGAGSADWHALLDPANQHPEQVVSCLPILFLALVYQNVVPTIVTQLEGDRTKITQAIVGGTALPLLMFVAWNAVVLGNALGSGVDLSTVDPVAALQTGGAAGAELGPLVSAFSSLAVVTSLIGFSYGLVDAWTDVFRINTQSPDFQRQFKLPLLALVFGPPLALSVADPDIFYRALEYGGAFGVSTLFLVLPPIMVWQERYGSDSKPLITKPMVPFGKLSLGSMWKAAGTLIVEQGAEKLGVFDFLKDHIPGMQG